MQSFLLKTSKIILYDEPGVPEIRIDRLKESLREMFPVRVETRGSFFEGRQDGFFEEIASAKICDLKRPFARHVPTAGDVSAAKEGSDIPGDEETVLYDGFEFQKITAKNILEDGEEILHVIFTSRLTCTFDEGDWRYHARAVIGSNPAIISTTGMVEAPARPKQYYLDLMAGSSEDKVRDKYEGEFLEHHDSRLSEIAEGYLLQSVMYYETGEAFCDSRECRLYNAHWQSDLIYSQIQNKKFCKRHSQILEEISRS